MEESECSTPCTGHSSAACGGGSQFYSLTGTGRWCVVEIWLYKDAKCWNIIPDPRLPLMAPGQTGVHGAAATQIAGWWWSYYFRLLHILHIAHWHFLIVAEENETFEAWFLAWSGAPETGAVPTPARCLEERIVTGTRKMSLTPATGTAAVLGVGNEYLLS